MSVKSGLLIVDDDQATLDSLSKYLSREYTTYRASNGRQAIVKFNECSDIEIILSDIEMPEMEGIEMIEKIRVHNRDIIIIVMTAVSSSEKAREAVSKGADVWLSKPIDLETLEMTIKKLLRSKKGNRHSTLTPGQNHFLQGQKIRHI